MVLLGGLGMYSTLVTVMQNEQKSKKTAPNVITDPVEAERAVSRILGV